MTTSRKTGISFVYLYIGKQSAKITEVIEYVQDKSEIFPSLKTYPSLILYYTKRL
jgi:hypothetical protein